MKYWRMAFRDGNQGYDMWPHCCEHGVAVIGYGDENGEQIVGDCRKLTEDEYNEIWKRKCPGNTSSRVSLKRVAYEMKRGDVIYVKGGPLKGGPFIVGKGTITKEYDYDPDMLTEYREGWDHYLTVDWEKDFSKFRLDLDANLWAVLKLDEERLRKIRKIESETAKQAKEIEAKEGKRYTSEATFRSRNRALIDAKKDNSDYCCEVCEMSFKEVYGVGEGYIIAHHVNPIGSRKSASKTTLDDIALVCSNCHDMIHRGTDSLMSVDELRSMIKS